MEFAAPTEEVGFMHDIVTASGVVVQDVKVAEQEQKHQSDALDEALKESFPASDPVAVDFTEGKISKSAESSS